jgi:hypothetical protein
VARDGQAEINRPAKAENRLLLSTSHAAARSCERSARISSTALCHELHHGRNAFSPRRGQFAERRVRRQRNRVYLKALLAPYPSDGMICWPVSPRVGNVKNNDPSLVEPVVLP